MPTVILLDVSLSMARNSENTKHHGQLGNQQEQLRVRTSNHQSKTSTSSEGTSNSNNTRYNNITSIDIQSASSANDSVTKKALAVHSIYRFLDGLGHQAKLEYVSLVIFSSWWEITVPFTRDYDLIKSAADNISLYDKTCLDGAFTAALHVIQATWGTSMPCQVVIITDGLMDITPEVHDKITSIVYPFPCDFQLICLSSVNEFCCSENINRLNSVMEAMGGNVATPEGCATFSSMDLIIDRYIQDNYKIYSGMLYCGNLSSNVQLYPPPSGSTREDDFTYEELSFPHQLNVVGFISQSDIRSPACISRHLVLPLRESAEPTEPEKVEDGRTPSFTVLLHGALRVESYVAIVKIREEWYGMLHSWADSRKKSNLVLSVFKPGSDSVPWLGSLKHLSCIPSQTEPLPGVLVQQVSVLPVPVTDKKSYSNTSPSWLRQATLQSDVQKLLRYGRKLPEKLNIFYKELNRIHKAALSIGFYQLLTGLSQILERECTLLPPTAHPDAAMQLQHAAGLLCKKEVINMNYIIRPLVTNFQTE